MRFTLRPNRSVSPLGSTRWAALALASLLGLLTAACGDDPGERLPEGWTLTGRTERLAPVLERLRGLESTPLAREAADLGEAIAGCERFVAHCKPAAAPDAGAEGEGTEKGADGGAPACRIAETVRCVDDLPDWVAPPDDDATTEGVDWALAHRRPGSLWMALRASSRPDGGLLLEGEAGPTDVESALSLLLPSDEPPGPARMADAEALVHLRVRPDGGLNLARFVQGEGFGARMYRLRSDLFEGKALAGVWELAIYTPGEDEMIPPLALAVDVEEGERDLAVDAMEQFLGELREVWPVRRSDYELAGHPGACLGNVRVMPELAPCYIATPEALVIGWNPRSLELALAPRANGSDPDDLGASGGRLFFSRFPAADVVIARTTGAPAPVAPEFYPWSLAELTAGRRGEVYHLRAVLRAPGEEAAGR